MRNNELRNPIISIIIDNKKIVLKRSENNDTKILIFNLNKF